MNKNEFLEKLATDYDVTKADANEMYTYVFNTLVDALSSGDEVAIGNLGKFAIKERAERTARNPKTGEEVIVSAHKALAFKPSKSLKDMIASL